jgi:hypothetical protein
MNRSLPSRLLHLLEVYMLRQHVVVLATLLTVTACTGPEGDSDEDLDGTDHPEDTSTALTGTGPTFDIRAANLSIFRPVGGAVIGQAPRPVLAHNREDAFAINSLAGSDVLLWNGSTKVAVPSGVGVAQPNGALSLSAADKSKVALMAYAENGGYDRGTYSDTCNRLGLLKEGSYAMVVALSVPGISAYASTQPVFSLDVRVPGRRPEASPQILPSISVNA